MPTKSFQFNLTFPIDWDQPGYFHRKFNYFFDDDYGFCFGPCGWTPTPTPSVLWKYDWDMAIYYGDMGDNDFLDCRCSRWDTSNLNIILETWLTKGQLQTLRNNITPGAVGSFKMVIDNPRNYDATWQGNNTIKVIATPSSNNMNNSNLKYMRNNFTGFVKNISEHNIEGSNGMIETKLEIVYSSNQEI